MKGLGTETAGKAGYKAGRDGLSSRQNPYPEGSQQAAEWERMRYLGIRVKVGRGKTNASPWCEYPTDCRASGRGGLCRSCCMKKLHADPEFQKRRGEFIKHAQEVQRADPVKEAARRAAAAVKMKALWQDPDFRKKRDAAMKKAWADPEKRARIFKGWDAARKTPEFKEIARKNLAKTHNAATRAKQRATRIANGHALNTSQAKKVAKLVAETDRSFEDIGREFGITGKRVAMIAQERGTYRRRKKETT